jgi:hypothetical protein
MLINSKQPVFTTSIAASFSQKCDDVTLIVDLEGLRTSVRTRITTTKDMYEEQVKIYPNHEGLKETLLLIEKMEEWATKCKDVVSFGEMMSWIEIHLVIVIRLFIFDSAVLQLFAYVCERVRLGGEALPDTLDALLSDERIGPLLFLDERPKNLRDCEEGIEKWSDPDAMLKNLGRTQRRFRARCKPIIAEQIFDKKGRVTQEMVKRLKKQSFEQYLDSELNLFDPVHLQNTVISVVKSLTMDWAISITDVWVYLRYIVLNNSGRETELLEEFKNQWKPDCSQI